jgi:hypothetical protein
MAREGVINFMANDEHYVRCLCRRRGAGLSPALHFSGVFDPPLIPIRNALVRNRLSTTAGPLAPPFGSIKSIK